MEIIRGTEEVPHEFKGAFITIGNFDGIHRGHRHIFNSLIHEARKAGRKCLLVTFIPHPKMILHPERRPFYLLTTFEEKIRLLRDLGLDAVILIPFTMAYAETTAESFVIDFLWKNLKAAKIFIGHDYTFGKGKGGNKEFLAAMGKKLGFDASVINAFSLDGDIVSSTRIRLAIMDGNVKTAALLLGRPYNVSGTVVEGKRRGAAMGFPTANIKPYKELLPRKGVYAAIANFRGERYRGVLNIGKNPTFGDNPLTMELHLLNFQGDIYGSPIEVLFIDRLRDERTFAGTEELASQIKKDVQQAENILTPYFP